MVKSNALAMLLVMDDFSALKKITQYIRLSEEEQNFF